MLASTFAVSHNVAEAKPLAAGPTQDNLTTEIAARDWGMQQILTSANWGGVVGNFFTGGLNLQVEHHLFPAISFCHYPAIAAIVADECEKRGVQYASYQTLPEVRTAWAAPPEEIEGLAGSLGGGSSRKCNEDVTDATLPSPRRVLLNSASCPRYAIADPGALHPVHEGGGGGGRGAHEQAHRRAAARVS